MSTTSDRPVDPVSPPARPQRHRIVLRFVAAAIFSLLVAVFALPDLLFELDRRSPFAQLVSFRPWVLVGVLGLLVLVSLVAAFRRVLWPFAAGLVVVLLVGGVMVLPRAIADPLPTSGRPLTVLAFNTFEGSADASELAALIDRTRPDVISLEETGREYAGRLAPLVEPLGYRIHTAEGNGSSDVHGVTALVAQGLGDVQVTTSGPTPGFPWVQVSGGGLGTLRFVAFHSVAPMPRYVPQWEVDLAGLRKWCGTPGPVVVAGDFNATLDHSALRAGMAGCADSADQRGAGLIPTWGPTARSRGIGPQIDHVLTSGGIAAETFDIDDIAGSDHRAVLTRLRIPA